MIFALLACTDGGGSKEDQTLVIADENNFNYTGSLNFPTYTTKDLIAPTIDWSTMTKDMLCHDLDPATTVQGVGLSLFPKLDHQELQDGLTAGTVLQSDLFGFVNAATGGATSITPDEMTFNGYTVDFPSYYKEYPEGSWLFNLAAGPDFQDPVLVAFFLDPTSSSDATTVDVVDNCDSIDFTMKLTEATPIDVQKDAASWTADWSGLVYTGHGDFLKPGDIDTLVVANYSGKTFADLEPMFLDLDVAATQYYTEGLTGGDSADLAGLVDGDGNAFAGFDADGAWILALRCSTCLNPAPLAIVPLNPV